jgi:hypothetical protein
MSSGFGDERTLEGVKSWPGIIGRNNKIKWPGDEKLSYMVHVTLASMEVIAASQAEPEHDGDLAVKCALLYDVIEDANISNEKAALEST